MPSSTPLVVADIATTTQDANPGDDDRTHAGDHGRTRPERRLMAAIFNLNHPAHTVHWHFFSMSVANVVVLVLLLVVFAVAILAPFPRHGGTAR